MKDLISVVVPVYRVEQYLDQCMQSILKQTYPNLEIILVDDGSPDRCGEWCDKYQKNDVRVQVIHQKNGGLSKARNAGIERATGDYITFVDSDDYIHPKMYEILLSQMKRLDAEVGICDYLEVSDTETRMFRAEVKDEDALLFTKKEAKNGYYIYEKKARFVVAWNKLYKRELFDKVRYPEGKVHEDTYTTYKALYKAKGIAWVNKPLYYYRIRNSSITGKGFCAERLHILEALQEQMAFYRKKKEYYLWGVVFTDYRDYVRAFQKEIKSSDPGKRISLEKYWKYLKRNLRHMNQMELSMKKRVKTYLTVVLKY